MQCAVRDVRLNVGTCAYALVPAFRVKLLVTRALHEAGRLNVAEFHPFFSLLSERAVRAP